MGYGGKLEAQARARVLRSQNRTLADIARLLGVAKSSVSVWVRHVPFTPSPRRTGPQRRRHPQHLARLAEIAACDEDGIRRIGELDEAAFLAAGVALYAGEGSKSEGKVLFANTDPGMVEFFCGWLRHFFEIDEARMRVRSTCMKVSTLTLQSRSGLRSRRCLERSSASPTGPFRIRASVGTSTRTVVCTSTTAVPERIARSWG